MEESKDPTRTEVTRYQYDRNGNRVLKLRASWTTAVVAGAAQTTTLAERLWWDSDGRLSEVWQEKGDVLLTAEAGSTLSFEDLMQRSNSLSGRYRYDYRGRRVYREETTKGAGPSPPARKVTAVTFSGGTSVAEYELGSTVEPVPALDTDNTFCRAN
jgi:hypothetical protein